MKPQHLILESINRMKEVYHTSSAEDAILSLYRDFGDDNDIITQVQLFEKTAYQKKLPWLCLDICYHYFRFKGAAWKADYLKKGLKYWRYIGYNDEVDLEVPEEEQFRAVFKVLKSVRL